MSSGKTMSFYPYSMNGGTVLGIAGEDYALIASDTRLCEERAYMIHSREHPHTYQLGPNNILAAVGFHGDVLTLVKMLEARVKMYRYDHHKEMSTNALSMMLSTTLYQRRFFPLYVTNLLAGLDEEGKGALYSYDVVGSFEREAYRAGGSSSAILQSFLDNSVGGKNRLDEAPVTSKEDALNLARDIFVSAAERDIHCGDSVLIKVITKQGIEEHHFPLRRD